MTGFAFSAQGILGAWALPLRYKKLEMRMFGRVRPHVAAVYVDGRRRRKTPPPAIECGFSARQAEILTIMLQWIAQAD